MRKRSSNSSDNILQLIGTEIPTAAAIGGASLAAPEIAPAVGLATLLPDIMAHSAGQQRGLSFDDKKKALAELKDLDSKKLQSLIPFVGSYRESKRHALTSKLLIDKNRDREATGGDLAAITGLGLLGALNPLNWVGTPIGMLAAAMTPKKTVAEEYKDINADSPIKEMVKAALIPGYAGYTSAKTSGVSDRLVSGDYTKEELTDMDRETKRILLAALREKRRAKKNA